MPKLIYGNFLANPNEVLARVIRGAQAVLIINIMIPVLIILLDFFFMYPLFYLGRNGLIIFILTLAVAALWLGRQFMIWQTKVLVITNQRIIDIDRSGLFKKIISEVPLMKIDDVFYQQHGLLQALFKVGDLKIIIQQSKFSIMIKNIKQRKQIQLLINQLRQEITTDLIIDQCSTDKLLSLLKKIKLKIGSENFLRMAKELSDYDIAENGKK